MNKVIYMRCVVGGGDECVGSGKFRSWRIVVAGVLFGIQQVTLGRVSLKYKRSCFDIEAGTINRNMTGKSSS